MPKKKEDTRESEGELAALRLRVAELERANAALAGSESQWRSLLHHAVRGHVIFTRSLKPLFANRALAGIFGYRSPKAILAMDSVADFLPAEVRERTLEAAPPEKGRGKASPRHEVRLKKMNGERIWVEFVVEPVRWDGEEAIHASFVNVIARREVEDELSRSHHILDTVFKNFPQALTIKDPNGRFIKVNDVWCETFGFRPEQVVGKIAQNISARPAGERREILEEDRNVAASGSGVTVTTAVRKTKKRGVRQFQVIRALIKDEEANVLGQVSIGSDITDQQRTQEELLASRAELERAHARLNDAIESLPISFALYDREDRLVLCNSKTVEMFPHHAPLLKAGTSYEELLRVTAKKKLLANNTGAAADPPNKRIVKNRHHLGIFEQKYKDGRWLSVSHHRTTDGGTVTVHTDITERKRAEEELKASQRLFSTVLDIAPVAIFMKDREGRFIVANKECAKNFGMPSEDVLHKKSSEIGFGTAAQMEKIDEADRAVLEKGERVVVLESDITLATGVLRRGQTVKVPVHDEDGTIVGLVGARVDLTERKQAEEKLRASELQLQTVFDTIPHVLTIKDSEGRYIKVNRAWCDAYGVAPEEAVGKKPGEFSGRPKADVEAIFAEEKLLLAGGESVVVIDQTRTRRDGALRSYQSIKAAIRDGNGGVTGIVAIAWDVTEKKQADEELQNQKRLLQAVFDAIPMGIAVKDRGSRFLMVNERYALDAGLSTEDFTGLPHFRSPMGTPEDRASFKKVDEKVISSGVPQEQQNRITLPDGRRVLQQVKKVPLRDDAGAVTGILAIIEDITERQAMQDRMRHVERMEAIGTLAGGIAHDFNNILFPIIGFSELVQQTLAPDSEEYKNLGIVRNAANRARDIVSQILLFTRQTESKPKMVGLEPVVREGLKFLRSTLPKNISVVEEHGRNLPNVFGDATQLQRVFINLCVNAQQAMAGGGKLTVSLKAVRLKNFNCVLGKRISGDFVCLSVSDTGMGISEATLSQIFEPFYTTKPVGEGTGLGLSSVLGIVEQHGGALNVISEVGRGSTFEVYLEAMFDPEPPARRAGKSNPNGNESILFVDDEKTIADLAEKLLRTHGYQVSAQTSPTRALEIFRENPAKFDLVISDQMMPELTGVELTHELRSIRKDIRIILSSGFSEVLTPQKVAALHLAGFYNKPITTKEFLALVRDALGPPESPNQPPTDD